MNDCNLFFIPKDFPGQIAFSLWFYGQFGDLEFKWSWCDSFKLMVNRWNIIFLDVIYVIVLVLVWGFYLDSSFQGLQVDSWFYWKIRPRSTNWIFFSIHFKYCSIENGFHHRLWCYAIIIQLIQIEPTYLKIRSRHGVKIRMKVIAKTHSPRWLEIS